MTPTVTISLDVPPGTRVSVQGIEGATKASGDAASGPDPIQVYWDDYLSNNGRTIYRAAARIEDVHGRGYSFEDIARTLSLGYESVKSMHRLSGRTARRWKQDHGSEAPIRLLSEDYTWDPQHGGNRTYYRLPPGAADAILALL